MFLSTRQLAELPTRAQKKVYGVRPKGHLAYSLLSDANKEHTPQEAC